MRIIKIITMLLVSFVWGSIISIPLGSDPLATSFTMMGISTGTSILYAVTGWSIPGLASTVDITSLSESAIRYDKDLKMLPVAVLREELGKLGIALIPNIQNKDVRTNFERHGGIMAPYSVGMDINNSDLGKAIESVLEVHDAYASVKDNIRNYKTEIIGPDQLLGKNTNKKHPWQQTMLWAIVSTFGEDLGDCLFGGTRNASGLTPKDLFNGFDTLLTSKVSAGDISASKGNLYATGAITAPADASDVDAFDQLWAMWANAHPALKNKDSIMMVPFDVYVAFQQAHFNKFKYAPKNDEFQRYILEGTAGRCKIVPSPYLGTGDRIILTIPGNFDFGMDSMKDHQFVQVRDIYEDPNYVQFWIQGSYGVRINSVNKKVLCVNDGTPIHTTSFAGDYDSAAS